MLKSSVSTCQIFVNFRNSSDNSIQVVVVVVEVVVVVVVVVVVQDFFSNWPTAAGQEKFGSRCWRVTCFFFSRWLRQICLPCSPHQRLSSNNATIVPQIACILRLNRNICHFGNFYSVVLFCFSMVSLDISSAQWSLENPQNNEIKKTPEKWEVIRLNYRLPFTLRSGCLITSIVKYSKNVTAVDWINLTDDIDWVVIMCR